MRRYIGALDHGTTSTRFMVFETGGRVISSAQREHRQIMPGAGLVEHDALEIWRNARRVVNAALKKAGLAPNDLAAIGIANQRETCLLWDRQTGLPLHHALVWQDTRSAAMVAQLSAQSGKDRLRAKTGLPLATYFSGLKLRWLLDHVPGARRKAEAGDALFGTIDSWLTWNLTGGPGIGNHPGGVHVTDVTNASRTQLMNIDTLRWDEDILALFGIPAACLPEIRSSSDVHGVAVAPLAGVPIAGILGDQSAALLGQACLAPGSVKNTYGTGCFMLMNTGEKPVASNHGLLTTLGYKLGAAKPVYALEGSVAIAGALVQWLRDNLKLIRRSADVEALAASVPDNGDVYLVPAFSGLYAPYWREDARGIVAGLTRFSDRGHLARAALEATAYQTRDVLKAMEKDIGATIGEIRVDGGMVANSLLMQFQADILGLPVVAPENTETTALGAAYAAGLAVGYWRDTKAIAQGWQAARRWTPTMAEERRDLLLSGWSKAIERSMGWQADEKAV